MKERISKNLQLNLFITVISGILSFILNKYFSIYLGMENLGLMRLFSQLIAYLSLAELGIGSAAAYALYKPFLEKNYEKLNLIISTISSFYKKIASIILIAGLLLNLVIPLLITTSINNDKILIYWSLYVINTSVTYTFAKYPIIFTANQEYGLVRKISGLVSISIQIIQIGILIYTKSFILYIIGNILNNLICFYYYKKYFKKKYAYIKKVNKKDKEIIKDIKNMFYHKIGGLVVSNTDYIILARFTNLSIVAVYSSYLTIYSTVMVLIGIVTSVITPTIGAFIAKNKKEEIYIYWDKLYIVYMFLGTVFVLCTYRLMNPFVNLWLGENYILPKVTLILIMINLFISITRIVTDIFKECSGFFEDIYLPIFESILNLIISLVLVKKLGLDGVIIGTICSNLIVIYILKPILVFKYCFDKSPVDYLMKLVSNLSLVFLCGFLIKNVIKLLDINFDIIVWIDFIKLTLVIGLITTWISICIFMLNNTFRSYILYLLRLKKS